MKACGEITPYRGMMLWVFKRAWTTVGIQLMDGHGDPVAPFYYVKNACQPVHIQALLPHFSFAPGEEVALPLVVINKSGARQECLNTTLEVYNRQLQKRLLCKYNLHLSVKAHVTAVAEESVGLEVFAADGFLHRSHGALSGWPHAFPKRLLAQVPVAAGGGSQPG